MTGTIGRLPFGLEGGDLALSAPPFPITVQENPVTATIGTAPGELFKTNGDRWAWYFWNTGSVDVYLGFSAAVSSANGIPVAARSGFVSMCFGDDGESVWKNVWVVGAAAGATFYSFEQDKAP